MAKWMVSHGARYIVLLSRRGGETAELKQLIEEARDKAEIVVKACDIANEDDVYRLIQECTKTLPSICGVVHAAMMLHVSPTQSGGAQSGLSLDCTVNCEPNHSIGRIDGRYDPRLVRLSDPC